MFKQMDHVTDLVAQDNVKRTHILV
jgi:hypothetical protein